MPSVIKGYEYDIFISYRQKDNKADKWVTHFVEALQDEIEATFKEDIAIYFDKNPHDGLLETHDVDQSLQEKIKVLVFIPIISQTYCDPNCFAWQKEFIAFRDFAREDELGIDIQLSNGNVCKRILPVRIHEIDSNDQELYEKETGGVMRSIDFIYHASGVNRSLTPQDDDVHVPDQIFYRNQINKVANAVKEIINALKSTDSDQDLEHGEAVKKTSPLKSNISVKTITITSVLALILAFIAIWYFNFYNQPQVLSEESRNARVAIIPFTNNTNDPELDVLGDMAADWITKGLMYFDHIKVVGFENVRDNIEFYTLKDSNMRAGFVDRTDADKVIRGSFYLQGDDIVFQTQVINLATNEVELALPLIKGKKSNLDGLVTELNQRVMTIFGLDHFTSQFMISQNPPKYDSYKMFSKGWEYFFIDYDTCRYFYSSAIRLDSTFVNPYIFLWITYSNQGRKKEADSILASINHRFINLTPVEQGQIDWMNAKTNRDKYGLFKIWYQKDSKNFIVNYQMGYEASRINRPNEVISIRQNFGSKNVSFKNPVWARHWFYYYTYNLIRLNKLDKALEVIEVVPPEFMGYLYSIKALVFVLKDEPAKIYKMIAEMEELGLEQNLIIETYLNTSDWHELQGDSIGQMEWARMAFELISLRSNPSEISKNNLAWAYYGMRNYNKALTIYQDIAKTTSRSNFNLTMIGICFAKSGSNDQAKKIINELASLNTASSKYGTAQIYATLNEKDLAIEYLEEAFKEDYPFYLGSYDTDCILRPLHGHPGYEKFVKPKG